VISRALSFSGIASGVRGTSWTLDFGSHRGRAVSRAACPHKARPPQDGQKRGPVSYLRSKSKKRPQKQPTFAEKAYKTLGRTTGRAGERTDAAVRPAGGPDHGVEALQSCLIPLGEGVQLAAFLCASYGHRPMPRVKVFP